MRFRPCIDLHNGKIVQIVGGSLNDEAAGHTEVNFESERSPVDYARIYKKDGLIGGHVISLGRGNRVPAIAALNEFPGGFQMGGGITPENAKIFLDAGASHVIVTSYVFNNGRVDKGRLEKIIETVGKERLVLDLSCRIRDNKFWIVTDRWQKFTDVLITKKNLEELSEYCDEFLVHGVDVEGKRQGIQEDLVELLGRYCPIPVTYAGGIRAISELDLIKELGQGRVDATIGSALDIFGGDISYLKVVKWHKDNLWE